MVKLPQELRSKLMYASELPQLAPPTVHCFCGGCAATFYDALEYKIWRTEPGQAIKEPCEICKRPGYDYTVQRRRYPLRSDK
jgi:hypothetical protein